nr:beta-1,3-galactosyltransferase 1-like isoform X2 [Helicoverpa armigera]
MKRSCVPRRLSVLLKTVLRIILQKWLAYLKFVDDYSKSPRRYVLLLPTLLLLLLVLWPPLWWYVVRSGYALLPPPELSRHYVVNRSLQDYLDKIGILLEPKESPCGPGKDAPIIIMVSTTAPRTGQRTAVRETWGLYQPTLFVMGIYGDRDKQLAENIREAEEYHDLLVFDFRDQKENQTLKTALMMKYTLLRCPIAHFMLKTQDNAMVNPWMLNKVIWQHLDRPLVGYALNDTHLLRDEYRKGYNAGKRYDDEMPMYLSGAGYLIKGEYIEHILRGALHVPIVHLEDVYFTYLVAHKHLGLVLTHDSRLSPFKPWWKAGCVYWNFASLHGLTPAEIYHAWSCIETLISKYKTIADFSLKGY